MPVVLRSFSTVMLYILVALSGLYFAKLWIWAFIWPVLGLILYGFSAAAHECIHRNYASSRKGNRVAGACWMTPLLLNYSAYKRVHLRHHSFNGRVGDPEYVSDHQIFCGINYLRVILKRSTVFKPLYSNNWLVCVNNFKEMRATTCPSRHQCAISLDTTFIISWIFMASCATVIVPQPLLFCYWIPVLFFAPTIFALLSLPEHLFTDRSTEAMLNTRTVESNAAIRFLIWNINYHTAHHMCPQIPFYNLRKFDQSLVSISHRMQSYTGFHIDVLLGAYTR